MDVKDVLDKYSRKLGQEIGEYKPVGNVQVSREYYQFKRDMMPEFSRYERWSKSLGNIIKIKLSSKDEKKVQRHLEIAHLEVNPGEVMGLAIIGFLLFFFIGFSISIASWLILGNFPGIFLFLMLITSFFLFYYFYSMPSRLATKWRLKASSQMVPAVLYTVVYMKHTSNLERAIGFVSDSPDHHN